MYAGLDTEIPTSLRKESVSAKMLFSWRQVSVYIVLFGAAVLGVQRLLRHTCEAWITFDCPYYWPVSIFELRNPGITGIATAALVIVAFFTLYHVLDSRGFKIRLTMIFASLLILGTSLIQGI